MVHHSTVLIIPTSVDRVLQHAEDGPDRHRGPRLENYYSYSLYSIYPHKLIGFLIIIIKLSFRNIN
jgi:hypothetical protein